MTKANARGTTGRQARPVDVRTRIVEAAAGLIESGGEDAATTRAVAAAAGVQAPTIYRLFGDKRGMLDAVAQHQLAAYVARKARRMPSADPVQDLRDGWDMHVAFGVAHPELYAIMQRDPQTSLLSPAIAAGEEVLRRQLRAIAAAGRLKVSEDRAVALLEVGCCGTVHALLGQPVAERDAGLSAAAREAVLAAITVEGPSPDSARPNCAATALQVCLDRTSVLSAGERHLLAELLKRIANEKPTPE